MKGVHTWLICWARCGGSGDFCPALAALAGPVQNIFFLTGHNFLSRSKRTGSRAVSPVSSYVSLV
jgi:hypothetical protein